MQTILLISRCPPYPLHLGDRLIIWHLARELSQAGYTLDLLAFAQFDSDWHETDHYAPFFRHITLIPEPVRTPLAYLKRVLMPAARFPTRADAAWSAAMWQQIDHHLAHYAYDGVHLFGSVQVYEFAHLLRDMHSVITPYESYSLFLKRVLARQFNPLDVARRAIAQRLERWMFTPYPITTVVAPPDKAELHRLNPALDVRVIPNGVDTTYFDPDATLDIPAHIDVNRCGLLFTGNYEYAPNHQAAKWLITRILPAVRQHIPDAQAWIVGNAPPADLQALASDDVLITGRVPDMRPYLKQAAVFVCPLVTGAGIKNKVLEALAMGVPVIATPLSMDGIQAQPEQHALVAEVDTMAAQVVRLLGDAALRQGLSQNGRQLIETAYSWQQVAQAYAALYQP